MSKEIEELKAQVAALSEKIPPNIVRIFTADEIEKLPVLTGMIGDLEDVVRNFPIDHQNFVDTMYRIGHDEDGNNVFIPMVKSHNARRALMRNMPWIISGVSLATAFFTSEIGQKIVGLFQ